ncbi:winged helix-turn-helix transcriptional regulator [Streptomyces sp. MBT65]|uniref:helix-turn-helix transcriptional regulator n=1 Tax=Streptomyces sp. MBT65 TaxID=1488395 RepID=UPI00190D6AD1|nr:winged helix-turn-helix domain-containing protein [Streptomyces sp. MBT65]MBK3575669.1 winged helix-turn-helix transcriptional regulator [Streptomyces sp. MBT65]
MDRAAEPRPGWTFLTNHSRVLAAIAADHTTRVRDIAVRCQLTERAVQKIIADLEDGGYLTHVREGRSNVYRIASATALRHPADAPASVADLLAVLAQHDGARPVASRPDTDEEHRPGTTP